MGGEKAKLCLVGKSASVEPEHLLPLAAARRPDGACACRLGTCVVGTVGWEQVLAPAAGQAACKPW